ncbi:MAG TPA: aldo/keto reductase [Clostridia bacterium]
MINHIKDCTTLRNGVLMPWFGLGVWQVQDEDTLVQAVHAAVRAGYRSIDTARAYLNEEMVGKAIATSPVPREELFVTTKLWNGDHGYDSTLRAYEDSLKLLGLERIDLYLIHWPVPMAGKYVDSWKAMIRLLDENRVGAIGVCNFKPKHIDHLIAETGIAPMVDQVECHPLFAQKELLAYCQANGIQMEAYSPLLNGRLDRIDLALSPIASKYGKTPAQIALRWQLDRGVVVIPKSVHENRIQENGDIFDFQLDAEDIASIDALDNGTHFLPDPDENSYVGKPGGLPKR